jgi:hypothetical protein
MSLEWAKNHPDALGYHSTCKRYSVCVTRDANGEHWEAWKLVPGGVWFAPLAINLPSEEAAKARAQQDANA